MDSETGWAAMLTLASARRKLKRAQDHFDQLKCEIDAFEAREPFGYRSVEVNEMVEVLVVVKEAIPDDVALILGDCIHNLRSALDHVVYEAVGKANSRCEWPMPAADGKGPSGPDWTKRIKSKCPGGGEAAVLRRYIQGLQPFPGGKDDYLWLLHRLDIIDKHRLLLTVCGATKEVREISYVDAYEVSSEHPDVRKFVPNVGAFDVTWVPAVRFPLEDGTVLREYSLDGWEKLKSIKVTLSAAIGEVSLPVSGQALVPTTQDLIERVDGLIEHLAQQFRSGGS